MNHNPIGKIIICFLSFVLFISCDSDKDVRVIYQSKNKQQDEKPQDPVHVHSAPKAPVANAVADTHPTSSHHDLTWQVPSHWSKGKVSSMRLGSYIVKEGNDIADVTVFLFRNGVGDVLSNINRWRQQMSLPTMAVVELEKQGQKIQVSGFPGTLVNLKGKFGGMSGEQSATGYRMLGLIAITDHGSVVVKMTGTEGLIANNSEHFASFYKSFVFKKH